MKHEFKYRNIPVVIQVRQNQKTRKYYAECSYTRHHLNYVETPYGIYATVLNADNRWEYIEADTKEDLIPLAEKFMKNYLDHRHPE